MRIGRARGIGYAVHEFSRACLIRLIDYPEMPFRIATREIVKVGRTALIVRTDLPIDGRMVSVAYKRVRRRNWLKIWTGSIRKNRTLKTWQMGRTFLEHGIPTARPLAVILTRSRLARDAYLVTEWLHGAMNLDSYCRSLKSFPMLERHRKARSAAARLGDTLGRMHASGISHRDLKTGNLLLVDRDEGVAAYVVDLDGAECKGRLPRSLRLKNLARLVVALDDVPAATHSLRLRFLKSYLSAAGDEPSDWKPFWNELNAVSIVRRIRKQRRAS